MPGVTCGGDESWGAGSGDFEVDTVALDLRYIVFGQETL